MNSKILLRGRKVKREISFKQLAWTDECIRELIVPEGLIPIEYCEALNRESRSGNLYFYVENDCVIEKSISSIGD